MVRAERALVISCIPYSRSNRGIDIITQALPMAGFQTTHLAYAPQRCLDRFLGVRDVDSGIEQDFLVATPFGYVEKLMGGWPEGLARLAIRHMASEADYDFDKFDLIVVESGKPALLAPQLPQDAVVVYRQSDAMSIQFKNAAMHEAEKRIIERADAILTVRDRLDGQLLYGMEGHKATTIVNGFDSSSLEDLHRPDACSSAMGEKQAVYVGYCSIDAVLVAALSRAYPDVLFHIVGDCVTRKGRRLLSKCGNVRMHGNLKASDFLPLVARSDVGIVPYAWFPLLPYSGMTSKFLMFMYLGLSIVSMDVGCRAKFPESPHLSFCKNPDEFIKEFGKQLDQRDGRCAYDVDFSFYSKEGRLAEYVAYFEELMR